MKKKQSITYSVFAMVFIVGAYLLASTILSEPDIKLSTVAYHVCQNKKFDNVTIQVPNVTDVYQQLLAANADNYPTVILFPTYEGVWEDELAWLTKDFGGKDGIPIMLEVFYPGNPVIYQLTTDQIIDAMKVCNVEWLRFAEVISRCCEENYPFPTEYVSTILNFCREHDLKLFWTEWKVDFPPVIETFRAIQTYISGFEDIVTVSFSTNSQEMEPAEGFAYVRNMFLHMGGSVQSWYWETKKRLELNSSVINETESRNMPIDWLIEHALACRDVGAEVIQFEPYWYFFGDTDGKARDSLKLVHESLNSK